MSNVIEFPKRPRGSFIRVQIQLKMRTLHRLNMLARKHGGSFDEAINVAIDALDATRHDPPPRPRPPSSI